MIVLPFVPSEPFYQFATVIEDQNYVFDVRWNGRDSAWYFDVQTETNEVIRRGIKVVLGAYLGRVSTHALFENGAIVALDTSRKQVDATFDDIGVRVFVLYLTALELQALINGDLQPVELLPSLTGGD